MTTEERFWKKVNKEGPIPSHATHLGCCWLWTASLRNKGYGAFGYRDSKSLIQDAAHRYSWKLHIGPIPKGICVLHHCDTPACINPNHLWLGTKADNNADMKAKGRKVRGGTYGPGNYKRGHAHHNTKLNWPVVREIRTKRKAGASYSSLSREYHLAIGYVFRLIQNKTWKEETQGKGAVC